MSAARTPPKPPSRRNLHRAAVRALVVRTEPKFPKERKRKQHKHPLKDAHGAYTLVGKPYELIGVHPTSRESVLEGWVDGEAFGYKVQRKWLAGVSERRGF